MLLPSSHRVLFCSRWIVSASASRPRSEKACGMTARLLTCANAMPVAVQWRLPFVDATLPPRRPRPAPRVLDHLERALVWCRRERPGQGRLVAERAAAVSVPRHASRPVADVFHAAAALLRPTNEQNAWRSGVSRSSNSHARCSAIVLRAKWTATSSSAANTVATTQEYSRDGGDAELSAACAA